MSGYLDCVYIEEDRSRVALTHDFYAFLDIIEKGKRA